jgi:ribosome-associated translation inhibitor RaiA
MILPLHITFRNLRHSSALEDLICEQAARLDRFYDRITSCRAVVEAPKGRHRSNRVYNVRIAVGVPGREVVVKKESDDYTQPQDIHVVILDAFRAKRRRLQDYVRRHRGDVKTHAKQAAAAEGANS